MTFRQSDDHRFCFAPFKLYIIVTWQQMQLEMKLSGMSNSNTSGSSTKQNSRKKGKEHINSGQSIVVSDAV